MTTTLFFCATQWQQPATLLLQPVGQHPGYVLGCPPQLICCPGNGHSLTFTAIDFNLAPGDSRGGHIQHKGSLFTSRNGNGNRVCPYHGILAKGWYHQRCSIGHRNPNKVVLQCHHGIIPSNPVVIRIADGSKGNIVLQCLIYNQLHSPVAYHLTQPIPT